jgi:hypothetical protein
VKIGNEARTNKSDPQRVDRCVAIHENAPLGILCAVPASGRRQAR